MFVYILKHIQAYSQSYIYHRTVIHIQAYFSRFRHIQDLCITGPNSVNQHLLFKSGSSLKSLFISIWNIFFHFYDIQHFLLQDSILEITITTMLPTLATHPHKYVTHLIHATHASTLPIPATLAYYALKDATHADLSSTLPTQARRLTLTRHLYHPQKHVIHTTHASTNSTTFLKLG